MLTRATGVNTYSTAVSTNLVRSSLAGIITDTELQIGQFVLPKHGTSITNDSFEARYRRAWKEELSSQLVSTPFFESAGHLPADGSGSQCRIINVKAALTATFIMCLIRSAMSTFALVSN